MRLTIHWRMLLLFCLFLNSGSLMGLNTQRFTGVLRHDDIQRDQLAKLDLIASVNSEGREELMAVLTLQFGDYLTQEYVSYHFDNVIYNPSAGWMILDQSNQESGVKINHFTTTGFEGSFRSNFSKNRSRLILRADGKVPLQYPMLQPIHGEYQGDCGKGLKVIRLYTFRSTEDTTKVGHPFADYEIRGEVGEADQVLCSGLLCVRNEIGSGSYNFMTNVLKLDGRQGGLYCKTNPDGINCGECDFKRTSKEMKQEPVLTPPVSALAHSLSSSIERAPKLSPENLEGFYSGYLHHELLDQYQAAAIDILTIPSQDTNKTFQISALARLYFGDTNSEEAISYRYDPVTVTTETKELVLKKPSADIDAVLQISEIGHNVIKGTWYSLLFGRVGTFQLFKNGAPALASELKLIGPVHGSYESAKTILNIDVGAVKTPLNTENPFFPLTFSGTIRDKFTLWEMRGLQGGSYDFYTGKIAFFLPNSGRYLVGTRIDSDTLNLIRNTAGYSRVMNLNNLQVFKKVDHTTPPPPNPIELPPEIVPSVKKPRPN